MLSKTLIFFLRSLAILLAATFCFPGKAVAQSEFPQLISLPIERFVPNGFIVYGKAPTQEAAGIAAHVQYRQTIDPLPDLEVFFEFGGTLELLTTASLSKHDIAISEIMWGSDDNYPTDSGDHTYTQWIELYNSDPNAYVTPELFLLFTPLRSYSERDIVGLPNGQRAFVLDAVSNLHLGRWDLPGRSGRRPFSEVISAYRNIIYADSTNRHLRRSIVPFGSYQESWEETPERGRRNIRISSIEDSDEPIKLPYVATPGTRHASDVFLHPLTTTPVRSDQIVINEVRNDISSDNFDWIELKNVGYSPVQLDNWELSIVTGVRTDIDLVDLPEYEMAPDDILLLQNAHPESTPLADGINIANLQTPAKGATHRYFVVPSLNLPNTRKFLLLLRSETDKNGQDAAIEDYAGDGFFTDAPNTEFWPRQGQQRPKNVANFGDAASFGSPDSAWARIHYDEDNGHHKDAWRIVGNQGGIGYAPRADRRISPGTPGYENNTLKTHIVGEDFSTSYDDGEITISEIMADAGPRRNKAQWIELYNSSHTQAVNLEGWGLEIRNLEDDIVPYVNGNFIFNAAIILPNQTLLLVSKRAPHNVVENHVYDLQQWHRRELKLSNRWSSLLNPDGFYIKLTDKRETHRRADEFLVDEAGNLSLEDRRWEKWWDLPPNDPAARLSLVRLYGERFMPNLERDGPNFATDGTIQEAWQQTDSAYVPTTYYGNRDDKGTPGYRLGGPLPVQLTNFRAELTATGGVFISWTTESELDNAGFNILRGQTKEGAFGQVNPTLIPGAGTTAERNTYTWTDATAKPNVAYYYRIEDVSFAGDRQRLATIRMKGYMSASGKLTTMWGDLKALTPVRNQ